MDTSISATEIFVGLGIGILLVVAYLAGVWTGIILKTRSREIVKEVRVERIEVPTVTYIKGDIVTPPPPVQRSTSFVMDPKDPATRRERADDAAIGQLISDMDPEAAN